MSVSSAAVSVLLNLKLLTLNVNIDNLIKTQKSHTNVSNYQNGILPLLIRTYRVPVLKFHQISMYKYIHSTLAFGRVTALLTRVVQILKNRAVKEQENPCGFDVNAFSVAGRHYRLMLVKLLKTSKCQDRL